MPLYPPLFARKGSQVSYAQVEVRLLTNVDPVSVIYVLSEERAEVLRAANEASDVKYTGWSMEGEVDDEFLASILQFLLDMTCYRLLRRTNCSIGNMAVSRSLDMIYT